MDLAAMELARSGSSECRLQDGNCIATGLFLADEVYNKDGETFHLINHSDRPIQVVLEVFNRLTASEQGKIEMSVPAGTTRTASLDFIVPDGLDLMNVETEVTVSIPADAVKDPKANLLSIYRDHNCTLEDVGTIATNALRCNSLSCKDPLADSGGGACGGPSYHSCWD